MMWVLSCKRCSEFAWYMLNQASLDRGPDWTKATCSSEGISHNCWDTASAGEIE